MLWLLSRRLRRPSLAELVFLWPPPEYIEKAGPCLCQCLKVREGRRKGARSWQDHFVEKLLSADCPGHFKQSSKSPTIFHSGELDITMDVHVDDGYVAGRGQGLVKVFT